MELWQLRYFVAVAEELHFGRAAARLNVAQPSVTRTVQSLEHELKTPLLLRDKRRVELTAAGRAFEAEVREVLARLDAAARLAQRTGRGEAGRLTVGFEGSSAFSFIPLAVEALRARHPDVSFELLEMSTAAQITALRERRIEVGFIVPPAEDPALDIEIMESETIVVAMPNDHKLARNKHVTHEQLAGQRLILAATGDACGGSRPVLKVLAESSAQGVTQVNDMQLRLSFVAAGQGLALVPASAAALNRTGLSYRPLRPAVRVEIGVARLKTAPEEGLLARFIEAARTMARAQARGERARAAA